MELSICYETIKIRIRRTSLKEEERIERERERKEDYIILVMYNYVTCGLYLERNTMI